MNILFLCDEYPPCKHGGIGTVTQTLARELAKQGHKVFVCGLYPYYRSAKETEYDFGVIVNRKFYGNKIKLKLTKHRFIGKFVTLNREFNSYLFFLKNFIIENKIDIIESPDFNEIFRYSGPNLIRFPKFDIPLVIKLHGTYTVDDYLSNSNHKNKYIFQKEKFHINNGTQVVSVSQYTRGIVSKVFNYNREIEVIYNGVSITSDSVHNPPEGNVVIFAGTLAKKKGILSLIRSWPIVLEKVPDAKLNIYGKGTRDIMDELIRLVPGRVMESIEFHGFIKKEELVGKYKNASCAVFPSHIEYFSLAPMESMSMGCPTIYTKRVSGPELIENGVDGLLVEPDDVSEIARAIISYLQDKNTSKLIGTNGFKTIKEKFNIVKIANLHIELFRKVINNFENPELK